MAMEVKRQWFSAKAVDRVGEVYIFDEIGYWGTDAKAFMTRWKAIAKEVDRFELRINSPGGDVMAASGIYNVIASEKKPVDVYVVGFALSAASWIAMAGKRVRMAENGVMMLHNPSGLTVGDANAHQKTINALEKVKSAMVTNYASKSGKTVDEVNAILDEETWYTAEEALAEGFVDEVITSEEPAMAACFEFKPERFRNVPEDVVAKFRAVGSPEKAPDRAEEKQRMDNQEKGVLTLEGLRASRPDLATALVQEGHAAGVKAERDRITAIRAAAFDGQDDLVKKLIDEGTGVTESVVALNQDQKTRNTTTLNALEAETLNTPVKALAEQKPEQAKKEVTTEEVVANFKHQFMSAGKDEVTAERMARRAAGV